MRDLILAFHLRAIARMLERDPAALERIARAVAARRRPPRAPRVQRLVGLVRDLLRRRPTR